jgi:hypothetical protein
MGGNQLSNRVAIPKIDACNSRDEHPTAYWLVRKTHTDTLHASLPCARSASSGLTLGSIPNTTHGGE